MSSDFSELDSKTRAAVESLGSDLERLADLDDDQLDEVAALMETLGYDDGAAQLRASRRSLLKTGGAIGGALLGGGLMGSAATGRASAGNEQTGVWGSASEVQDAYLEDVYDHNDNNPMSFPGDGSVNIDRVITESLPILVRLYKADNGNAVAIARDSGTVIDEGSNHAAVIQSAISHVDGLTDTTVDDRAARPEGWIDGGGETFTVSQSVEAHRQNGLRNIHLDADGNSGFVPFKCVYANGNAPRCIYLRNLYVSNSGDSDGIEVHDGAWHHWENVTSYNHGGRGCHMTGMIGTFLNCSFIKNADHGLFYSDTAGGGPGNLNQFLRCNFADNGGGGLRWEMTDAAANNIAEDNTIRECNFGFNNGLGLNVVNGFRNGRIIDNWMEDSGEGIYLQTGGTETSDYTVVEGNRLSNGIIKISHCTGTKVRDNAAKAGAGFDLEITSYGTTDTVVEYNDLGAGTYTDNGTNTTRTTY
jgi:hypothetical protein